MKAAFSPSRSRGPSRGKRSGIYILAGLAFVLAAAAAGAALLRQASAPEVYAVDPSIGVPGAVIRIVGKNFGRQRGDSRVEFDDASPTASSYITWTDGLVEVRVPLYAESALVRVRTGKGRSNARMFMSKALLPTLPDRGAASAVAPVVESLSADSGPIGSLLVIRGLNFGANRDDSSVLFTWEGSTAFGMAQDGSGNDFVAPSAADGEYVSWSDKEIRVRVPDGAVSGGLLVKTNRGSSAPRSYQISQGPGTKVFTGSRKYALSSFVTISRVRSALPNALYLWMPFPAVGSAQRGLNTLSRSIEPFVPDFKGLSVYRLSDIQSDKLITVTQDHLVQVFTVDTEIKADRVSAPSADPHPAFALFTKPDELVPSASEAVQAFVKKTIGKERNPYKNARVLLDAMLAAVTFAPGLASGRTEDALGRGRADSWDMALLYAAMLRAAGVPSLPVAGVVVDDAKRAIRHYWVEFYLQGFGWVPVDPVLYSGAAVESFGPLFEDPKRYFGDMDNGHIAFTRGLVAVAPITPDGRTVTAPRRYSFQTVFEESSGSISSYTSFWSDVEITGIY